MEISSDRTHILLSLESLEVDFLIRIFSTLISEYETEPGDLNQKTSAVWFSPKTHQGLNISDEDRESWNQDLFEYRADHCKLIEHWKKDLRAQSMPISWKLNYEEAEKLVAILNDYRLSVAAKNDLADAEL
jgi:hypothetical protein